MADIPLERPGMKVERQYESVKSTFPAKHDLKAQKNRRLRNRILNYHLNKQDRRDCDDGLGATVLQGNYWWTIVRR